MNLISYNGFDFNSASIIESEGSISRFVLGRTHLISLSRYSFVCEMIIVGADGQQVNDQLIQNEKTLKFWEEGNQLSCVTTSTSIKEWLSIGADSHLHIKWGCKATISKEFKCQS